MALNHAHHFRMENAIFNTNIHQYPQPLPADPADILALARAAKASHTSSAATYATKCHPETRKKVIADIADWVVGGAGANEGSCRREAILWFSGPAGAGKTCVMRSVVDLCEAKGLSAASFFFSARGSGLTSEQPFVATVVHQLTTSHPSLQSAVLDIIRARPTIFEDSLDFQMDRLLVRPLQSPTPLLPPSHKIVIAIDGLDECSEEHEREHLLNLLHTLVTTLPHLFVIVIASRPEFDLRRIFKKPEFSNITKVVQLQDYDGTKDIWVFLCDEFEEIRQSHPLRSLIPEGWPFEDLVQLLLDKSSGNFVLPATAARYIKTSRRNPVESLNIIVGLLENPSPDKSKPFAELDALYSHILHPPDTEIALIKRILHYLLGIATAAEAYVYKISRYRSPVFLDGSLGFLPGTTTTTLCDLHSILSVPDSKDEPIEFHHKSLEDYLLDPERSQDLFQSRYDTHVDLAMVCAMRLTRWDANPVVDESDSLYYAILFWGDHLKQCTSHKPISATLPDIILNMDPGIVMKYEFVHDFSLRWRYSGLSRSIHDALCSTQHCVRVCQLLSRMQDCSEQCDAFSKSFKANDDEGRLKALPRFISDTVLYAPLHPDSRTVFDEEGEPHLQNPSTPNLVENLSSPNLLRNSSTPDLYQSPPTPDLRKPSHLPNPSAPSPLPSPPTPDLHNSPATPDLQKPSAPSPLPNPPTPHPLPDLPTPDHPRNSPAPNLPQNLPAPNPSFLRRLGRRIMRRLTALCQQR